MFCTYSIYIFACLLKFCKTLGYLSNALLDCEIYSSGASVKARTTECKPTMWLNLATRQAQIGMGLSQKHQHSKKLGWAWIGQFGASLNPTSFYIKLFLYILKPLYCYFLVNHINMTYNVTTRKSHLFFFLHDNGNEYNDV